MGGVPNVCESLGNYSQKIPRPKPEREYLCNFLGPNAETRASETVEVEDKAASEVGRYCERGESARQKQSKAKGSEENAT